VPDATALTKSRRRLEEHKLTAAILAEVSAHLIGRGVLMRQSKVVDATLIAAGTSTKNEQLQRDPESQQTQKGKRWQFGLKMPLGVDSDSGQIPGPVCAATKEAGVVHADELLQGHGNIT
jgi:transposase, IS5 family